MPRVNPVKGNPTQTAAVNGGTYSAAGGRARRGDGVPVLNQEATTPEGAVAA